MKRKRHGPEQIIAKLREAARVKGWRRLETRLSHFFTKIVWPLTY